MSNSALGLNAKSGTQNFIDAVRMMTMIRNSLIEKLKQFRFQISDESKSRATRSVSEVSRCSIDGDVENLSTLIDSFRNVLGHHSDLATSTQIVKLEV